MAYDSGDMAWMLTSTALVQVRFETVRAAISVAPTTPRTPPPPAVPLQLMTPGGQLGVMAPPPPGFNLGGRGPSPVVLQPTSHRERAGSTASNASAQAQQQW